MTILTPSPIWMLQYTLFVFCVSTLDQLITMLRLLSLLLSAAQQYNAQIGNNGPKMAKRRVYKHEILDFNYEEYFVNSHDIDMPITNLEINITIFQSGPRLSY